MSIVSRSLFHQYSELNIHQRDNLSNKRNGSLGQRADCIKDVRLAQSKCENYRIK